MEDKILILDPPFSILDFIANKLFPSSLCLSPSVVPVDCLKRARFTRLVALTLVKKGRDGKYTSGYSNNRSG